MHKSQQKGPMYSSVLAFSIPQMRTYQPKHNQELCRERRVNYRAKPNFVYIQDTTTYIYQTILTMDTKKRTKVVTHHMHIKFKGGNNMHSY